MTTPGSPPWLFDESRPIGVDYSAAAVAEDYDRHHEGFRDYATEAARIADDLALDAEATIMDIGCGTGGLAIHLARRCARVHAVDPAAAMLERLRAKIDDAGVTNILPQQAGFLTFAMEPGSLDAVVCNVALHHLPDCWKQVALCRLADSLRPGGKLLLVDVVFDFPPRQYHEALDGWIAGMAKVAGEEMAAETVVHVRDEFSTWTWVMEGMLERAGFTIDRAAPVMPHVVAYRCSKTL